MCDKLAVKPDSIGEVKENKVGQEKREDKSKGEDERN